MGFFSLMMHRHRLMMLWSPWLLTEVGRGQRRILTHGCTFKDKQVIVINHREHAIWQRFVTVTDRLDSPSGMISKTRSATVVVINISAQEIKSWYTRFAYLVKAALGSSLCSPKLWCKSSVWTLFFPPPSLTSREALFLNPSATFSFFSPQFP